MWRKHCWGYFAFSQIQLVEGKIVPTVLKQTTQSLLAFPKFDKAVSILQWSSLETWSRSRDESRDRFLRVSVSVSNVPGLETLNIANVNGWLKFLYFNDFCLLYLKAWNFQNTSEKCQRFEKNSRQEWWRHFYNKFWQNAQILKCRFSVSEFLMKSHLVSKF